MEGHQNDPGLECLLSKRLRERGLFSLEKGRLWGMYRQPAQAHQRVTLQH